MHIDVSIIVPVYNNELTLVRCFESILAQDFQGTYEVIVCLDNKGGTDASRRLVFEYATKYPEIFVVCDPGCHVGLSINRWKGYEMVRGDYVYACDSDDELRPDAVRVLFEAIHAHDADLANCSFYVTKSDRKHARPSPFRFPTKVRDTKKAFNLYMNDVSFHGFIWTKMFKAELLKTNPKLVMQRKDTMFEDVAIVAWLLANCKKVVTIPDPLYYYHKDNPASMVTKPRTNRTVWHLAVFYAVRLYLQACGNEELLKIFLKKRLRIWGSIFFDMGFDKKFGADKEYQKACKQARKYIVRKEPVEPDYPFLAPYIEGAIIR